MGLFLIGLFSINNISFFQDKTVSPEPAGAGFLLLSPGLPPPFFPITPTP